MKKRKILALITIVVTLCFTLSGCLGILGDIINGLDLVFNMVDSFGQQEKLPDNVVYGSYNALTVGFDNGKMVAFWDGNAGEKYVVSVTVDDITTTYDPAEERYSDFYGENKFFLEKADLTYGDNFTVSLRRTKTEDNTYTTDRYSYKAISASEYATYTANVPGGFTTIDYYVADRYELFEFFAYLIVFRPGETEVKEKKETYTKVEANIKVAYDYAGLYGTDISKAAAFESEMMSAVASFEDSAAYNYSYEIDDNDIGEIYLKFYYSVTPSNVSSTANKYKNGTTMSEQAHYSTTYSERTFPIDSIENGVTVTSGDQLYFAIKKGYKPLPVAGSNAELLYNRMRTILSYINKDTDNQPLKIHHIYDYLVNTVIYDYVFTEDIIYDDSISSAETFAFKCLYLEGVFGLTNEGTFNTKYCVAICDGLSKAFLCMTRIEGINSLKISGTASGGAHAWNKVQFNNRWYMVDTTWGNKLERNTEYLSHDYLMVPDDAKHVEDNWYTYPSATGKYSFSFM